MSNPYDMLFFDQCAVAKATDAIDKKLAELKVRYGRWRIREDIESARGKAYSKACVFLDSLDDDLGASDSEPRRAVYDKIVSWET